MPIIPDFRRLGQENLEFKANLGYIVRPCLKRKQRKKKGQGEQRRVLGDPSARLPVPNFVGTSNPSTFRSKKLHTNHQDTESTSWEKPTPPPCCPAALLKQVEDKQVPLAGTVATFS
jgi:hypothetical protein